MNDLMCRSTHRLLRLQRARPSAALDKRLQIVDGKLVQGWRSCQVTRVNDTLGFRGFRDFPCNSRADSYLLLSVPGDSQSDIIAIAARRIWSNIAGVSFPVKVFCWLT